MVSPSSGSGDIIGAITRVKDPATLQVARDGGSSAYYIITEKADGEGGRIVIYCFYWDAFLRSRKR